MKMPVHIAFVRCTNPRCPLPGQQIWLPLPNSPSFVLPRPDWPMDRWHANIACRECGHLREYTKQDVQWCATPFHSLWIHNSLWRVEAKCVQEDCESPIAIRLFAEITTPSRDLIRVLNAGSGLVKCSLAHPLKRPLTVLTVEPKKDVS